MAAAAQQQAPLAGLGMGAYSLGLTSPTLSMPNGLNMAQLAHLNGINGMNHPFNMNMLGISPEAQLLAAQIAAAGGGFRHGHGGNLSPFGLQQQTNIGIGNGLRSGCPGGRSPGLGGGGGGSANGKGGGGSTVGGSATKRDNEEDFNPAVLADEAGWLRTLRLHKHTPNFEGISWKEMVVMYAQALEAQGVAALGACRKMLKTFEVVRRKTGIDDPTAPLPPPPPPSAASGPVLAASTAPTLSSVGTGGGFPSALHFVSPL